MRASGVMIVRGQTEVPMTPMSDEAKFNEFVAAHSRSLMRTAYLLTHDHQLAEDLVQTALFKAAKAWNRIEGEPQYYVRRILYTESASWWRRPRVREVQSEKYDAPSGYTPDVDLHVSLGNALARLTPKQRAVLVLRYFEDLTEVQTAQLLGVRVSTIKSTHRQALSRLRTLAPDLGELIGANHE
jgi:RNA polymerase sigma-70 factor (sigma-E family)